MNNGYWKTQKFMCISKHLYTFCAWKAIAPMLIIKINLFVYVRQFPLLDYRYPMSQSLHLLGYTDAALLCLSCHHVLD